MMPFTTASLVTPSPSSSSSSLTSSSAYRHLLYCSESERDNFLDACCLKGNHVNPEFVSRFSSDSSSLASSFCSSIESVHSSQPDSWTSTKLSSVHSIPLSTRSVSSNATYATISVQKYADTHYPLISKIETPTVVREVDKKSTAYWCARQMALAHNTFIRALNASYNHALSVHPENAEQTANYLLFSQAVFNVLDHHHRVEDDYFFPAIEERLQRPGAMDGNIQSRQSFARALHEWERYIKNPATPKIYSGARMRQLITAFAPSLIQHLHDEIPALAALALESDKATSAKLAAIWTKAHKITSRDSDLYLNGPLILGCQDRGFVLDGKTDRFPPVPWILETVVRKWHSRRHRGAWEFCPSDMYGKRRMIVT